MSLDARNKSTYIGGYYSMGEGTKGAKYFYYILITHLGFRGEKWLHGILGEVMWCLITCNYINPTFGMFRGYSLILVLHSLFFIHYWSWSGHGK
jgi:hypothetical protein